MLLFKRYLTGKGIIPESLKSIGQLTCIKQIFHIKNVKYQKINMIFGQNYRVATLSTFYLTVSGIIKPSLKLIGQF